MTKKLSFLALFAAVAMLCAAPALSVKNAFLPDAGIVCKLNAEKFNRCFLGDFANNDIIGLFLSQIEVEMDPSDPVHAQLKALVEKSNITITSSITPADVQSDLTPEEGFSKILICVDFPQPLGPLADAAIAKLTAIQGDDLKAERTKINGFKGVKLYDDDMALALVFSADGKRLFLGVPKVLAKQLTAEAAAAAPSQLLATQKNALDNAFVSVGFIMTDEYKALLSELSPEAAGFVASVKTIAFSAAAATNGRIELKVDVRFTSPDVADTVKSLIDAAIPEIKTMVSAQGEDVACINTLACTAKGDLVSLSCKIGQEDISSIMQIVSAATSDSDDDFDYANDDDDDDDLDLDDDDDDFDLDDDDDDDDFDF